MNYLEKRGTLKRYPWISAPLQVALCGVLLTFFTPACCALFPQKASIPVSRLEADVRVSMMFHEILHCKNIISNNSYSLH